MKKILDEKLLLSDFTFGFELEAYLKDSLLKNIPIDKDSEDYESFKEYLIDDVGCSKDRIYDIKTYADIFDIIREYDLNQDDIDYAFTDKEIYREAEINFKLDKYFPDDAPWIKKQTTGFTSDGSLSEGSFEWRSPVMSVTPDAIAHCVAFLKHFKKDVGYVDSDCGFHTHISFGGISEDDAKWIMIKLSQDNEMLKKMERLTTIADRNKEYSDMEREPINFWSSWAKTDYLYEIREALKENNIEKVANLLDSTKYRALRIHPQGTLEWRCPRDFLSDDYSDEYIKSFFLSLYDFIAWMREVLDSEVEGDYNRQNLLELINSYDVHPFNNKNHTSKYKKLAERVSNKPETIYKLNDLPLKGAFDLVDILYNEYGSNIITGLIINGKPIPENILAAVFYIYTSGEIKEFIRYLRQPIPVEKAERMSKTYGSRYFINWSWMIQLCFNEMSKNDILEIIDKTKQDYYNMRFCVPNDVKKVPTWLNNAFMKKYGRGILNN